MYQAHPSIRCAPYELRIVVCKLQIATPGDNRVMANLAAAS
uniref:Uncharacterized protein n=1 Tax=Rhizobium rhizogenes TaxID=359 RepID=A0A7S5DRM6_RHIRH|nr:hypothetical protein pC5.7b_353 [Rhizobium rhizogenes]